VSGSGISWAKCKSAPSSRQITTPAPHCSVFYRPDAHPAAKPTVSKHWRHGLKRITGTITSNPNEAKLRTMTINYYKIIHYLKQTEKKLLNKSQFKVCLRQVWAQSPQRAMSTLVYSYSPYWQYAIVSTHHRSLYHTIGEHALRLQQNIHMITPLLLLHPFNRLFYSYDNSAVTSQLTSVSILNKKV